MSTSETKGPFEASIHYVWETLYNTTLLSLLFALICSPILVPLLVDGSRYAFFGLLGSLGWGIWYGQDLMKSKRSAKNEENDHWLVALVYVTAVLLYHNSILFIGIAFGDGFVSTGYPFAGIFIAFCYPTFDSVTANKNIPISFGGIAAFLLMLIGKLASIIRDVEWSSLGFDRITFDLASLAQINRPRVT